jgi:hypothetical protein
MRMTIRVSYAVLYPSYRIETMRHITEKRYNSILETLKRQLAEGLIDDYQVEILSESDNTEVREATRAELKELIESRKAAFT